MRTKYTKEFLEPIVKKSTSVAQVLKQLGLKYTGGSYSHIQKAIREHNIDCSHFLGQGHNKGRPSRNKKPIEYYLNDKNRIQSSQLRNRLLKEGYFPEKCQKCNLEEWLGEPIPLELHHIDCNPENNHLDNLTILCPNCHSLVHKS